MTPWGEFLDHLLSERELDQAAFSALVGEDPSLISRIMRGVPQYKDGPSRKPPLEKLVAWAEALQLSPGDRDRFIELGQLMHAPDLIAERYLTMKARQARNDERIRRLEDERGKH